MTKRLCIPLLLLALLAGALSPAASAQTAQELIDAGQLIVRTRLEPEGEVLAGQKVVLWVELLTATWFPSAPRLPQTFEVPGAIVVQPDSSSVNLTERVGGTTLSGISRRYLVFPQDAGTIEMPPVPLTLVVALESGRPSPELSCEAPGQRFIARRPPGSEGLGPVIAAPGLDVGEQWDPNPADELKVGESLTRTVTVTINDAVAMLIPPLEMAAVEGMGLYPGKPELDDRANRGQLTGRRTDSVTLIMEEEGTCELPELVYHWYDLGSRSLRKEVLPAVTVTVVPNPDLAAEHLGESLEEEEVVAAVVEEEESGTGLRNAVLAAAAVLLLLLIFRRRLARLPALLAERRHRRAEGEARYFKEFRRTAGGGDPAETMTALMAWLDRFAVGPEAATLQRFVDQAGDPELAVQADALNQAVYGSAAATDNGTPQGTWSGRRMARLAALARTKLLSKGEGVEPHRMALPSLNPGAGGNG